MVGGALLVGVRLLGRASFVSVEVELRKIVAVWLGSGSWPQSHCLPARWVGVPRSCLHGTPGSRWRGYSRRQRPSQYAPSSLTQ